MSFCSSLSLSCSPVMKTMLNESQLAARRGDGTKELPNSLPLVQGIVHGGGKALLLLTLGRSSLPHFFTIQIGKIFLNHTTTYSLKCCNAQPDLQANG